MIKQYVLLGVILGSTLCTGCTQQETVSKTTQVEENKQISVEEKKVENTQKTEEKEDKEDKTDKTEKASGKVYQEGYDIRVFENGLGMDDEKIEVLDDGLDKALIASYTYNENTDFKSFDKMADEIMEEAKNPGLGVRQLHKQGITGKGVNVAIIDQPLILDHPEYAGKVVKYENLCDESDPSSMHGPAVISILVGNTIGVAPEANVYYVAAPSWTGDAEYYAKALKWIIEENKKLPEGQKIRVVSAAPSGEESPFDKNNEAWDVAYEEAQKEGLLVLDCTDKKIIGGCFLEGEDREDPKCYKHGFGKQHPDMFDPKLILAPLGGRTTAEVYETGVYSYQYNGSAGLSWGIPYAAGTLALGWQIDPSLTSEEIVQILNDTAAMSYGNKIITPTAFIEAIQNRKTE